MTEPPVTMTVRTLVYLTGTGAVGECSGDTHYFDARPGRCRCGAEQWDADPPKLRAVE